MLKRFLLTFFWLFLLLLLYLLTLLPLLVVRSQLDDPSFIWAFCLWGALAVLSFIPVLSRLIKQVWFFQGTGETLTLEQLQERLLSVNGMQGPVQAIRKRKSLVFTWKYQETLWCETFVRLGLSRLYELHCRFDPATRTVFLKDRIRKADFVICPERVKIGCLRIPLPFFSVRKRRLSGIEQYAILEPDEYAFHPREIKSPIMGTILASGWNVRFSLF